MDRPLIKKGFSMRFLLVILTACLVGFFLAGVSHAQCRGGRCSGFSISPSSVPSAELLSATPTVLSHDCPCGADCQCAGCECEQFTGLRDKVATVKQKVVTRTRQTSEVRFPRLRKLLGR